MNEMKKQIESWPARWRTRKVAAIPELVNFLNDLYPNVELSIQINCFLTNKSPYCSLCKKPVKFFGKETCSILCRNTVAKNRSASRIEKQKQTILKKYGVDNIRKIPGAEAKRLTTMHQKYDSGNSQKARMAASNRSKHLNTLGRDTLKEKYGVDNPSLLSSHKNKSKRTLIKNYGVDHYSKSSEFQKKSELKKQEYYNNYCPQNITIISISNDLEKQSMFSNPNKIISFKCISCDTTDAMPSETFKWRIRETGTCCFKCSNISHGSQKENEVKKFIRDELKISIIENDRKVLKNKEIDIFLPEYKIAIEFDGLFWHNDLRIDKHYHLQKTKEASQCEIKMIHIFEDEWEHRKEIVKSRIRALTGKIENKIFARKCEVREINYIQEKEFLNTNHIQGYAKSSIKLGLFYENNLVSVMTFSVPSISKGQKKSAGTWELLRFCSILNTTIPGAAGKLFSYFVTKYDPLSVISFADKRWGTGNVYKNMKFYQTNDTPINYWYIDFKNLKRIHRFRLRKNHLDDKHLTEFQNRLNQGYLRIWDCGNSKWIWKRGH
jgi:hypothetical protein